ncbi:MAG TPA: tryptophan--tRNA ligase [Longimicrobiaceae bacterium]|nr:tryptophan--tRNA ligase [Longimicrobiaceae bacterium]
MQRILTGIQPSGTFHVGNYFGAMQPLIALQERGQVFAILVDLHALTTVQDAEALRANIRNGAVDFLACGLDPERSVFFRQSDVPAHAELMWILSTVTPMGLLERAHAYKDKVARGLASNAGLFVYPVLQAADILLYDADVVPVGKDQKQHLEIARDIAIKMNETYGRGAELVKLPEPEISEAVATVPGLDGQKMSKSYGNTIEIFAPEKAFRKRVMSIVTDSTPLEAPKDPAGSTIVALYRLVASPEQVRRMEDDFRAGGKGYGDFKQRLFEAAWEYFAAMRARREEILARPGYVDDVLADGARRAREIAEVTMERVKGAVGLK